jgi:hypothetical protein
MARHRSKKGGVVVALVTYFAIVVGELMPDVAVSVYQPVTLRG